MHWLIETCVLSEERVTEFRDAFDRLGLKRTFTLDVDQAPEPRRPRPQLGADVVAYGSKSVIPLALEMRWRPGAWSGPTFDYASVQRELGSLFLNTNALIAPFERVEAIAHEQGWEQVFIRPADDDKAFAGRIIPAQEIADWRAGLSRSGYLPNTAFDVAVAPPRNIMREWRVVIADELVAGASLYRDATGKQFIQGCQDEAASLALFAAKRYRPAPVFIADIAQISNGELAVVEYNAFNSADLYACNVQSVVEHVTSVAQRQDA